MRIIKYENGIAVVEGVKAWNILLLRVVVRTFELRVGQIGACYVWIRRWWLRGELLVLYITADALDIDIVTVNWGVYKCKIPSTLADRVSYDNAMQSKTGSTVQHPFSPFKKTVRPAKDSARIELPCSSKQFNSIILNPSSSPDALASGT